MMSIRKQKKHGYAERLKYVRLIESGMSFRAIHKKYGINEVLLRVLWTRYHECGVYGLRKGKNIRHRLSCDLDCEGVSGLRKGKNIRADYALKKKIVLDIEKNHLTLHAASLKYGASPSSMAVWLKLYREGGLAALARIRKRGRPPDMGRPRKNSKPLTELESLRRENQELKTEIALLKKVRALVEERNARL